ncbi:MAG: acyltransferase family protein [Polyangiaceae bacterium]|nr:acyltransferase family protein [Polyangiaceae bacterium]
MVPPNTDWEDATPPRRKPAARPPSAEGDDVEAQIRALEARLDSLIRGANEEPPPPSFREHVESAAQKVAARLSVPVERPGSGAGAGEAVRELMSSDYYLRQWGRLGMRHRSEDVDDFGLDPKYEARLLPLLDFLYQRYFRVETRGADQIPADGRCLVVANHSGTLPLDGMMLRAAVRREHPSARELRWLAEDFVFYLPFVGAFMNRIGAVRACQENAERLLQKSSLVAVFPEGVKGIGKLYRERYKLQRFGRGGFIRLALRTQTPVVPCAIVGAEEAAPLLYRVEGVSKLLGVPYLPVTPTFPALGPLGLLPAPTKWQIVFGEPIGFEGYGPEAADDHVLVGRLSERVRATIQRLVDTGLAQRQSVWLG